jgi:hypothetical protein
VWIQDLTLDEEFLRRDPAVHAGLESGVLVPVQKQDEVLAVLEFYGREKQPPNPQLTATLVAIGHELGHFFAGRRSQLRSTDYLWPLENPSVISTAATA